MVRSDLSFRAGNIWENLIVLALKCEKPQVFHGYETKFRKHVKILRIFTVVKTRGFHKHVTNL
jgi:hypothetical protein